MNAWSTHPSKVIIVDSEYDSRILPSMKHEAVFQVAIANVREDWIVSSCQHKPCNFDITTTRKHLAHSFIPS
jgi:hypothetical protein